MSAIRYREKQGEDWIANKWVKSRNTLWVQLDIERKTAYEVTFITKRRNTLWVQLDIEFNTYN